MRSNRPYIVVNTGPWMFPVRKVVLPAGAIERIDLDNQKIVTRLTKNQIRDSPELDETTDFRSETYRTQLGEYYDPYVRSDNPRSSEDGGPSWAPRYSSVRGIHSGPEAHAGVVGWYRRW